MKTTEQQIESLIARTRWGHMRPEIIEEKHVLLVGTLQGTWVIGCDMLGLPDPPAQDDVEGAFKYGELLEPYLPSGITDLESLCEPLKGWLCRMSASGYMDCTEWEYCETVHDVLVYVERQAEECEPLLCVKLERMRLSDGRLPHCTDMGGYPLTYYTKQGNTICPDCANDSTHIDDLPTEVDVQWEGDDWYCDDCSKAQETAYGPIETNPTTNPKG